METKSIWKSKIFWLQIIAALLGVLELIQPQFLEALGVPPNQEKVVLTVIGFLTAALTIVLRKITNKAIAVVALLIMVTMLSSCKFGDALRTHNSIEVVKQPTHPEDTISVIWKIWGLKDLAQEFIPTNNKVGEFIHQSTKHCTLEFLELPTEDANDTIALQLTCDSSLSTFKGWLPKNKGESGQ